MDKQQERIQADLRGLLRGEVRCDDSFVQMYATDASIYQIVPLGVARPRGSDDVQAIARYASENLLPIHARGAGTGLAGESLGPGLVVDFSRRMRRIVSLEGDTVTVQPGVVLGQLNRYLASFGRQFGPDPATGGVTTMGSVLALDNSGSNWLKYGSARRHVKSLQVVLADGETFEASQHVVTDDPVVDPHPRRRELVRRLADLIQREEATIQAGQPKSWVNRCGYQIHDVLKDGKLDLAKIIVGSEGTLALITQATLATERVTPHRGMALVFFDKLEAAAQAAQEAAELGLSACDLLDRRILSLARDVDARYAHAIPRDTEAMLLIEMHSDDPLPVVDGLSQVAQRWQRKRKLAFGYHLAIAPGEYELFRKMVRRVSPTLYRVQGSERPIPFVEDVAVPPSRLAEFMVQMQNVLKNHQVTASLFAHAGHGMLHIRPFLNLANPANVRMMQDLAKDLYEEVLAVEGTISGEHGCGLSRTWFVRRQYGPLYDVFREVKRIFDPQNLLNPGKVVADVPQPITKNLRVSPGRLAEAPPVEVPAANDAAAPEARAALPPDGAGLQLIWQGTLSATADACNGCGRCRTQSPDTRMCPIFRFSPAEEASPRAKANLMRAMAFGQMDSAFLASDAMKDIADLCVNCHQCRLECPAGVDIPKLMIEAKAQYVSTNGLDTADWIFSRLEGFSKLGMWFGPIANWALRQRTLRWLLEKVTGIARGRKLPKLASASFLRWADKRRLTRPTRRTGRKVLYFVDTYATLFDVELAEAFVAILQHNGVAVYVHPQQQGSGMAKISAGDLERARPIAAKNVRLLADAVRQGYKIVTTEPAAAACLKYEYPNLIDDEDARYVADNTEEACGYLWKMHEAGELELDLRPVNFTLGYHLPCHQKTLDDSAPGEKLLRLVPGLNVRRLDRGCSGMAGTFGLKRENYRESLRAGWGLISSLRDSAIDLGTTECSTCKMQMEQGTTKPTVHPLKVLALAYRLMPEIERLFITRGGELTVT